MTFIDVSQGRPSTELIVGFSFLCVISVCTAIAAVILGNSRIHYQSFFSVRVLFPLALFILALENAAYAASGRMYDVWVLGDKNGQDSHADLDDNPFVRAIIILHTLEVPILLVVTFEITYLVHKRRSVNFCGIYFDEGVRVKSTALMSFLLRNSVRLLALALLVTGLTIDFELFMQYIPNKDGDDVAELVGVAGWYNVFNDEEEGFNVYLLVSLLPTAVLTLVSLYLSIILWRYGTESSMVVHSSICNPWFYPFFGTLAMGISQLFADNLYTIMSNAGLLVFIVTILIVMNEVDKDMIANNDIACFLVQVAQKGDESRVSVQPGERVQEERTTTNTVNSQGFSLEKKQDHNCETLKSNADEKTINEATMNSSDVERGVVKREGVIDKINVKQLGER